MCTYFLMESTRFGKNIIEAAIPDAIVDNQHLEVLESGDWGPLGNANNCQKIPISFYEVLLAENLAEGTINE